MPNRRCGIDTNILLRTVQQDDPLHASALDALEAIRRDGYEPCIVPQNLVEFYAVATRSIDKNGLGWSSARTREKMEELKTLYTLLPDTPAVHVRWESLVKEHEPTGVQAHDTRIVASLQVHDVSSFLTFNAKHFKRYEPLNVIDAQVLAQQQAHHHEHER